MGVTFILGGARSGKSSFAEKLALEAERGGRAVVYLATCERRPGDDEMASRIERHRSRRPPTWSTVEEPMDLRGVLDSVPEGALLLVDCLSLWVSNMILALPESTPGDEAAEGVLAEVRAFLSAASARGNVLLVSNEVGCGIVPVSPLGRLYQDILGWANQEAAGAASAVWYLVAGLPQRLK